MGDYNKIIDYILNNKEIEKLKEKYKKEKLKQNEIESELRKLKIYLIEKVGVLFNELKVDKLEIPLFIAKKYGHDYYGIIYTLWFKLGKRFNPEKDLILLSNKEENIVDFSNLQLIKDFYDKIKIEIENKYKEDINNLSYKNNENEAFNNMILKKVEAW
jgi:hypothetical protein